MGATFSSIQVRSASQETVVQGVMGLLKEPAYVSPSVGGWVSVYSRNAEPNGLLAAELSRRLSTAVFDWDVQDSDVFRYSLYENGVLRDGFDSAPGYPGSFEDDEEDESDTVEPMWIQGNPQALLPYCVPGTTSRAVLEVLRPIELIEPEANSAAQLASFPQATFQVLAEMLGTTADVLKQGVAQKMRQKYTFAEHQAADLAYLLGMDDRLTMFGPCDSEPGSQMSYSKEDFRLVGTAE